jgi:hypothetical protein
MGGNDAMRKCRVVTARTPVNTVPFVASRL